MIYTVIRRASLNSFSGTYDGLIVVVNEMISGGWEPQGGIMIDEEGYFLQAMIDRHQTQTHDQEKN